MEVRYKQNIDLTKCEDIFMTFCKNIKHKKDFHFMVQFMTDINYFYKEIKQTISLLYNKNYFTEKPYFEECRDFILNKVDPAHPHFPFTAKAITELLKIDDLKIVAYNYKMALLNIRLIYKNNIDGDCLLDKLNFVDNEPFKENYDVEDADEVINDMEQQNNLNNDDFIEIINNEEIIEKNISENSDENSEDLENENSENEDSENEDSENENSENEDLENEDLENEDLEDSENENSENEDLENENSENEDSIIEQMKEQLDNIELVNSILEKLNEEKDKINSESNEDGNNEIEKIVFKFIRSKIEKEKIDPDILIETIANKIDNKLENMEKEIDKEIEEIENQVKEIEQNKPIVEIKDVTTEHQNIFSTLFNLIKNYFFPSYYDSTNMTDDEPVF